MQMSAANRFAYDDCSVARMPLSIIHAACQQSSRAASIFVAMSAIMKLTPWFIAIGMPNWTRSFEYCAAYSKAARATPTAPAAVPGRVRSSVRIAILKPSPSAPSRFAAGTRTSWNVGADDERRQASVTRARVGRGEDDEPGRVAGVGDEHLGAVEQVVLAVPNRRRLDRGDVGP